MKLNKLYFNSKLKETRLARDMTQKEFVELFNLASMFKLSLSLYQKWEIRNRPVEPEMASAISKLLKVNVNEITEIDNAKLN